MNAQHTKLTREQEHAIDCALAHADEPNDWLRNVGFTDNEVIRLADNIERGNPQVKELAEMLLTQRAQDSLQKAAPELLEALERSIPLLGKLGCKVHKDSEVNEVYATLKQAENAIAKAKGEK